MTTRLHIFGDSHSRYFFPLKFGYERAGLNRNKSVIAGEFIRAASLAGFRPGRSTLDTRLKIEAAMPACTHLVLGFGQVDLELGYYYRRVVKGEDITRPGYVAWLIEIYRTFLSELDLSGKQVALKGVNLSVLSSTGFTDTMSVA